MYSYIFSMTNVLSSKSFPWFESFGFYWGKYTDNGTHLYKILDNVVVPDKRFLELTKINYSV